ncbi:hypothetical protein DPMN_173223 [Dreissena polymorpha]|uniref:Uncharacterized protein n=1 Tax=Dreissena polymorpha TaxID=45954 RepID=A0A9D4E165_DREPO|nr:hypothetical protein DPMN_173221 [Dreissena polymorpha]KAH3771894.1 hypothetical protein DPMN_173223 [Dreissena polymorpha]
MAVNKNNRRTGNKETQLHVFLTKTSTLKSPYQARYDFNTLRPVDQSGNQHSFSSTVNSRFLAVKSFLLYGSETWRVINTLNNKLKVLTNRSLQNILKITWTK